MSEAKELTQIMGTRNNENEFRNGEGWKKKQKLMWPDELMHPER